MVESAHVFVRQLIAGAQSGPTVRTLEELAAEPQAQLRMRRELRHPLDSELLRALAAHAQHVRVVEAERLGRPRMRSRQSVTQLRVVGDRLLREDFGAQCAAVLRIAIDIAALECAPQHARTAKLAAMLRRLAGIAGELHGNLAQNHRLREYLRADHELRGRNAGNGQHSTDDDGRPKHCRASRAHRAGRARIR